MKIPPRRLEAEGRRGSRIALDDASHIWVSPETGVFELSARRVTLAPIPRRQHAPDITDGSDEDLTQEPEMIRAFRDTWELGIHSYLTYLRDRLLLARELLHESGSCFVQISDENIHLVRDLMDEVFGATNFSRLAVVEDRWAWHSTGLTSSADYLVVVRTKGASLKYRQRYSSRRLVGTEQVLAHDTSGSSLPDGKTRRSYDARGARLTQSASREGWRPYQLDNLTSGAFRREHNHPVRVRRARLYHPGPNNCWKTTNEGLDSTRQSRRRIEKAGRHNPLRALHRRLPGL